MRSGFTHLVAKLFGASRTTHAVLVLALVPFVAVTVAAQTNASKASAVGTWKLDVPHSNSGSDPAPKSVTLTILTDTPQMSSWSVEVVDATGKRSSFAWSGPQDGTMHPIKGPDGSGKESLKKDPTGVLLRHGEDPDGSSFDSRATMSADGNTITDVGTAKSKDGKVTKLTSVYRRASVAK